MFNAQHSKPSGTGGSRGSNKRKRKSSSDMGAKKEELTQGELHESVIRNRLQRLTPQEFLAFRLKMDKLQENSELNQFQEDEAWSKMRADRTKDFIVSVAGVTKKFHRVVRDPKAKSSLDDVKIDEEFVDNVNERFGSVAGMSGAEKRGLRSKYDDLFRNQEEDEQEVTESDSTAEAPLLPAPLREQWEEWITRKSKDKDQKEHVARAKLRRRHHRVTCQFHPYSASADFRKKSLQLTFPRTALTLSKDRVLHCKNGTSSGFGDPTSLGEFFVSPGLVAPDHRSEQPKKEFLTLPVLRGDGGSTPQRSTTPSSTPQRGTTPVHPGMPPQTMPSVRVDEGETFLTETRTMQDRCRTPNLNMWEVNPNLPFKTTPGPAFNDCDCTPRSTDDERDIPEPNIGVTKRYMTPEEEAKKDEEELFFFNSLPKSNKGVSTGMLEEWLGGSSSRAERKLSLWNRHFSLSTVRCNSALDCLLGERERMRGLSCNERQHLNIMTENAEAAGSEWAISRKIRCTTPSHGSVWEEVYDSIGTHEGLIARNRDLYVKVCDHMAKQFHCPSTAIELQFMEKWRAQCMKCSLNRKPSKCQIEVAGQKEQRKQLLASASMLMDRPPINDMRSTSAFSQGAGRSNSNNMSFSVNKSFTKKCGEQLAMKYEDAGNPLTESFFHSILYQYGKYLVSFDRGVKIANYWRERCGVGTSEFFALIYRKCDTGEWQVSHEVHMLHKRLMNMRPTANGGNAPDGSRDSGSDVGRTASNLSGHTSTAT